MTTDPIPDAAVEAAARAIYHRSPHREPWAHLTDDEKDSWRREVRPILTAAAPHIVKQSTADLRAGIEALAGEWRSQADGLMAATVERVQDGNDPENDPEIAGAAQAVALLRLHADALDALIGGA